MKKAAPFLSFVGAFSQLLIPLVIVVQMITFPTNMIRGSFEGTVETAQAMKLIGEVTQHLADDTDELLIVCLLAMIGLFLFIYSITAGRYRQPWAFWFACIYGCCLIPLIPIGTPFGIIMLVYALSKKTEFLQPRAQGSIPAY